MGAASEKPTAIASDRSVAMQRFVDELWRKLAPSGTSWLGFYLHESGDELILGPRRDKPACSPIGMHGACGRAFQTRRALVVTDVARLGANYVACDPRDKAELVIPLFEPDGRCWGVLDLDSFAAGHFSEADIAPLENALSAAGLSAIQRAAGPPVVV